MSTREPGRRTLLRWSLGVTVLAGNAACSDLRPGPTASTTTRLPPTTPPGGRRTPDVRPTVDALPERPITPAQQARGSFSSSRMGGQRVAWEVLYPPGHSQGSRLPVVVCLHGTGGNQGTVWGLRWGSTAPTLAQEGYRPFAVAGVAGGNGFWHPRLNGSDSGGMVLDEFLPLLGQMGLDVSRVGFYGISMGGLGAVWMGQRLGSARLTALALSSLPFPTSWLELPGAYNTPFDFSANDVRARWGELEGVPIRVEIGDQDPFLQGTQEFLDGATPRAELVVRPGGHNQDFWMSGALDQMRFLARHLG